MLERYSCDRCDAEEEIDKLKKLREEMEEIKIKKSLEREHQMRKSRDCSTRMISWA